MAAGMVEKLLMVVSAIEAVNTLTHIKLKFSQTKQLDTTYNLGSTLTHDVVSYVLATVMFTCFQGYLSNAIICKN